MPQLKEGLHEVCFVLKRIGRIERDLVRKLKSMLNLKLKYMLTIRHKKKLK
ncbi:hypothetical protein YC2023_089465 [Brassica napus]